MAACQAGYVHHAPAVSSQNIVRHDQTVHHEAPVHYAPVAHAPVHAAPIHAYHAAPVVHAAPVHAVHAAPVHAVHAAPAHHEDHYVDEYVSSNLNVLFLIKLYLVKPR